MTENFIINFHESMYATGSCNETRSSGFSDWRATDCGARPRVDQNVKTLIRRRILWRLIWICTFCPCPIYGTLGVNTLWVEKG